MKTDIVNKKSVGKDVLYPELSYQIMQAAFEVHNQLGPGFTEDIYEAGLVLELESQGIPFERQKPVQVKYKDHYVGTYRLDLVIDQKIILELKAVSAISEIYKSQVYSYLCAANLQLGIVINFGTHRVQSARVIYKVKNYS